MNFLIIIVVARTIMNVGASAVTTATLPTLYEHYTAGGIVGGLNADQPYFTLNDRNISIYSGAAHYFRIPKQYWRDRLRKMRAAGLNAVETYVPWNLHEPLPNRFDFGNGGNDMSDFLDVAEFLTIAKEEDLLAIVRPGPFICSEWEFGGFPSWLLRERDIKVRTSDPIYMKYVTRYFNMLLPILALLQFTKGGPIIAFQVENEYGSTAKKGKFLPDKVYLRQLRQLILDNGIVELLVTSDSPTMSGTLGTLPGIFLQTANFASNPEREFDTMRQLQPGKPTMSMEYWTGWFDHWSEQHHVRSLSSFRDVLERILNYPASVNMYMFAGGTSFGFMNGANMANGRTDNSGYQPDTTSYDYDAPLTESGDYTIKYVAVKELLEQYNPVRTRLPTTPHITEKTIYANQSIKAQLNLDEILNQVPIRIQSPRTLSMEMLPINQMSGQSYGYIVYRKKLLNIPADAILTIAGRVCDTIVVLVNGQRVSKPLAVVSDLNEFGTWRIKNANLTLSHINLNNATLDLLVENWGRNNFGNLGQFNQLKGLWQGGIYLDNVEILDWEIYPLEFKKSWTSSLTNGWHTPTITPGIGAAMYKTDLEVSEPMDTFIDMRDWCKGIVIVNGFVLGRYSRIGPQQTLYLPGPFLRKGLNSIIVFEHYVPFDKISFSIKPVYIIRREDKTV